MFIIQLKDRNGRVLNLGDLVKISDGRHISFLCKVTYDEERKVLHPFHTFSFHSVEWTDQIPENAVKMNETRFDAWYVAGLKMVDEQVKEAENYLTEWRKCERLLKNTFDIIQLQNQ